MLVIPDNIKDLFIKDNIEQDTHKKIKLTFYSDKIDTLYPYETLFPDEALFPSENESKWLEIENDRIVSESLTITESLSSGDDLVFGSCEGSEMEIIVADVIEDISGKEFTLTVEVGNYEMAIGIYTVKSVIRQSDRRKKKIVAYDRMEWFNTDVSQWYNQLTFPITIKAFRNSLCEYVGINQVPTTLIFDDLQITKTIEPKQIAGIDVLKAICEINGVFGHVNSMGELGYIKLQQTGLYPAEDLFPDDNELYPAELGGDGSPVEVIESYKQPMTYEDYLVEGIDGLTIRQEEGDVGASVGKSENAYIIEGNFLVYGKSAVDLLNIAQTLLPEIEGRTYCPAAVDCNYRPWLEVGDAIRIVSNHDVVETFVLKRTISGSQSMRDKISSTGNKQRESGVSLQKQIIQLEGKAAVIVRNVEEVSVRVTDLKNYTEAQFKVTADAITAEVKRATAAEGELSASIKINAESIVSEVKRATAAEGQLSSKITQTATEIRAEVTNTAQGLQSQITQNAEEIKLKVSKGNVSSQISIETGGVNITGNRFSWSASNSSMTADGNLTCKNIKATNGHFSGEITGSSITGSTIDVGWFSADSDQVHVGGFTSNYEFGRDIFQSDDGECGMSASASKPGKLWFWGGWNSEDDYDFAVDNKGDVWGRNEMHASEFYPYSYEKGGLVYFVDALWYDVEDLKEAVFGEGA